jgi:hypothetical protein
MLRQADGGYVIDLIDFNKVLPILQRMGYNCGRVCEAVERLWPRDNEVRSRR